MSAATTVRRMVKAASTRLFMAADRIGVHILPKHYYTSVPDYAWLNKNKSTWCRRVDLTGVHWDLTEQLTWLEQICRPFYLEVQGLRTYHEATGKGPGYGPIESQVLHCVCRSMKPRRLIEVGSGVSTVCALNALRMNLADGHHPCSVTCIEPFPSESIARAPGVDLVRSMVQTLPLGFFNQLEAGDVLFIDSSHSVKTGSDVLFLYLEVIPRLRPGVLVHLHDIFLPYLYQRDVLQNYFDWQETSLLVALLKDSRRLEVLTCLSALHYDARDQMRVLLTDYEPQSDRGEGLSPALQAGHFPASLWLTTRSQQN